MQSRPSLVCSSLRVFARLGLGLLLLAGLSAMTGGLARTAYAATTLTVTNCSNDSQLQADVSTANTDNDGDTITFSCSGDIMLSSTLTIAGSMTLDGSGQSVTLDGGNSVQVFSVNSGITFTLNALTIADGTLDGSGGGLSNNGTVNISNSTFANNSAGYGGGLYNQGGTVNISNSTFANNSADDGGGLDNTGTVNISNSTFANNSTLYAGGGFWNDGGMVTISNSTFAGNSAGTTGGGLYNNGTVNISGSIVAENTDGDCSTLGGTISDNGYNMDSDMDSCFSAPTDKTANPLLSSLASNGGPTQTMALQQGSPAIDVIPLSTTLCPATDQRGYPRPDNGESSCDMGAYEFQDPASLTLSGTSVSATEGAAFSGTVASGSYSGSGTLSASITWGDGSSASTGTVTQSGSSFTISGSHTYAEEGKYTITIDVSDGQGQSASATSAATVSDAPLTITQCVASALGNRAAKLTANFTDADPAGTVSDYTATIRWGDGSTSTVKASKNPNGIGFVLTGTHTYAKVGTYSITLTVTDHGGRQASKTVKVSVK